jgi:type II secretory pathway pseudopilin PulG
MRKKRLYIAFSLTETLLAVAALAIGMIFIAGTFLAGIHFATIATEKTIAAVAADEAFAKVRLYATGDPADPSDDIQPRLLLARDLTRFADLLPRTVTIDANDFAYPSTGDASEKQYYSSVLCRRTEPAVRGPGNDPNSHLVQVTVFVSRKAASASSYPGGAGRPTPMAVSVSVTQGSNLLTIEEPDKRAWINDGYRIVDDQTGKIYRVLRRSADQPSVARLDRPWRDNPPSTGASVWVVPPPRGTGKDPCIAIYQKVMRF